MASGSNSLPSNGLNGSAAAAESLHEHLRGLFAPPSDAYLPQHAVEAQISEWIARSCREPLGEPSVSGVSLLDRFRNSAVPENPSPVTDYVDHLLDEVVEHALHSTSPRAMGNMTSVVPYFMASLSKLMVNLNQNLVKIEASKTFSPYERQALAMIHRLVFGYQDAFYDEHVQNSESTLGVLTSGGTTGNLLALWCARNRKLGPTEDFAGVDREGMDAALRHYGFRSAVVIGSSLMHYSIDKAADVLGIGSRGLIKIPADENNRIDVASLRRAAAKCRMQGRCILAVVGVAGTTDTGSIDPLAEVADIAEEIDAHFHVDAAWGGPVLFSDRHRGKLHGIARADSVIIDGHKQLYLPVGVGMVLMRDPHLARRIEKRARYIIRPGTMDLGRRSLHGSRPAMALFIHSALQIIGRRGYEALIDESIRRARFMADAIRDRPEFELLADPELNIVAYRYLPANSRACARTRELSPVENRRINRINRELQIEQVEAGHSFVSRTVLDTTRYGRSSRIVALRAVPANPLTSDFDIEYILDEQAAIGARLEASSHIADRTQLGT